MYVYTYTYTGDEMGLGKTIQAITLLATLKHEMGISGPHLVVVPLAVLQNWANEVHRFAPSLTFKKIHGSRSERENFMTDEAVLNGSYDIYLTTYDTIVQEEAFFSDSWTWATIIIDEGHRIKNDNTRLRTMLNRVRCPLRIMLTGTPLQNNLHELWALLNFILPDIFASSKVFDSGVVINEDSIDTNVCQNAR
jgi:SNF2 family DNA or RNA helicase